MEVTRKQTSVTTSWQFIAHKHQHTNKWYWCSMLCIWAVLTC